MEAPECPPSNRNAEELIAVLAGSTSRRVSHPSTDTMALFRWLLPSLAKTVDCGFRYKFVLGYDTGDPYYDTSEGLQKATAWFEQHVQSTSPPSWKPRFSICRALTHMDSSGYLEKRNILIDMVPVRVQNPLVKKLGIIIYNTTTHHTDLPLSLF